MGSVTILESSPRDGLQNEQVALATGDKIELVRRAIAFGARRIEVASFVNPRRVSQMADGEAVITGLPDDPAVRYTALCLNQRGVDRAIATRIEARGVDEVGCVLAASDAFGIANQSQTVAAGIAANRAMIASARGAGLHAQATIAASFGCPYEGAVSPGLVLDLVQTVADFGAEEIAFADTIGVAVPAQVGEMVERAFEKLGADFPIRAHLHDTRGMGPGNAWAAYLAGCRIFDSALGGIGGCPFAPAATGNVATEELIYLFERSGISTGLDLPALHAANEWLAGKLGRSLPSRVGRAGDFHPTEQRESA